MKRQALLQAQVTVCDAGISGLHPLPRVPWELWLIIITVSCSFKKKSECQDFLSIKGQEGEAR